MFTGSASADRCRACSAKGPPDGGLVAHPPTWPICRGSWPTPPRRGRRCSRGETLRGLLLTSFGFSGFGTKAAQAATVTYLASGLTLILAILGFIHALVTPKSTTFAAPEPVTTRDRIDA